MSKMKSAMAMLAALTMMGSTPHSSEPDLTPEEIEKAKRVAEEKRKQNLLRKGVQEFTIDGHTVLARDYKNALRKVNNIKNSTPVRHGK